jgi:hypothetical protein
MNFNEEPNDGNVFYYTRIEEENMRNVTVVRVKSQVRVIKDGAFDNCTGLRTIFFNKRLDWIGVSAFCRCSLLRSINIPRYIRVIEKGEFQGCHGVMADLGKGLKIIGAGAFQHCSSLHHIYIIRRVRSIQKWAFSYCSRLTTLVLNRNLHLPIAFSLNAS